MAWLLVETMDTGYSRFNSALVKRMSWPCLWRGPCVRSPFGVRGGGWASYGLFHSVCRTARLRLQR